MYVKFDVEYPKRQYQIILCMFLQLLPLSYLSHVDNLKQKVCKHVTQ